MEENLLKPYSNGIATLDTEVLHKSKAWTDMSKGFNFEEKVGGTPYTLGDAIKVYNALKEGVDPGIAKKKHLDALIHAVESNSEVLDLANEVAESFPIKLESGWQTRAFAKEIFDSINNSARKRHLETFSNNVDAIFTSATLDLIADQYGEKYRQAIVSTLRRMKSGRNRVSTDANANSYMNWLNRAVGTTMFLNTRSTILQLLSTLNFLGKPGNNIFQATAAFANQKQWKADYNKLWNSDYLSNRRDGAKFDVLADEIAEGSQGLNKILKFGFLPTRYADSFAIALGGAAYYRNRVNMLMKEGGKVEEELVYNASPKSFDKLGERTGLIYLATNKREAKAYADMNRGNVKNIYINKNQVASEKDLISTMEELGINTTEGSVYELIDPRFDNFYIGKDAMNKVTNALAEKGFKAAKYEDGAQVVSGKVESIVVFDKSIISDKKGTIKSGMTQEQAQEKAFLDFREVAEEAQQ